MNVTCQHILEFKKQQSNTAVMQRVFQRDSSKLDCCLKQVSSAVLSFGVKGWMTKTTLMLKVLKRQKTKEFTPGNIYSNIRGRQLARNDS